MKKQIKIIINLVLIVLMFSSFFVAKTWADEEDNPTGGEVDSVLVDEKNDKLDAESDDLDNDTVFDENDYDKKEDGGSDDYTPTEGNNDQEEDNKTEEDRLLNEEQKEKDNIDGNKEETISKDNSSLLPLKSNNIRLRNESSNSETGYITFSSDNSFTVAFSKKTWSGTIEYSTDLLTWTAYGSDLPAVSSNLDQTSVHYNKLYFRGSNNKYLSSEENGICSFAISPSSENKVACSGNIETLLDYETVLTDEHPQMGKYCFSHLFSKCESLISAPELPAVNLSEGCYTYMFEDCTSLTAAPELPATSMRFVCYARMFSGCSSLVTAPALPATLVTEGCYMMMFYGCTSLVTVPELSAVGLEQECYRQMFLGPNLHQAGST